MKKKFIFIVLIIFICVFVFVGYILNVSDLEHMSFKEFNDNLENEKIEKVIIREKELEFNLKDVDKAFVTNNPNDFNLQKEMLLKDIEVVVDTSAETAELIFNIVFYGIFFGIIGFGIYKLTSFEKSAFKVVKHSKIRFENIAGMDDLKKEMLKSIEIMKNPKEYQEKGIRPTKGIILEGPPGNGKTLFARALAGETDVKFIATKGADFQSAMMSMGSRKIKTLFKKARRNRPCIIFIDEFDSIGERRNYAGTGVDKENNRIITSMLNEMDGFEPQDGILVIAATNSYNSLDPALIRPGRFDLKYNIPNPDKNTRAGLVDLYTKGKKLSEDLKKENMIEAFENLSSSAIESILNEASMLSILANSDEITIDNIINAGQKTNCYINLKKLKK